ncbi:phosphotransferase family protein [Streptomyces sp. NPDC127119]|uniref:phosphotransferase family protein n=1 Tax=Streptomyces sp. NPDC127119 TaxID=3345370 RepID=UPI0036378939
MTDEWTPEGLEALTRFLRERGLCEGTGELDVRRIGDGHSNLTFLVSGDTDTDAVGGSGGEVPGGTGRVVVRRPPPPPTPPGAHDMLREARLVDALRDTAVPVAAVLATAQAGEVIDVPFYVMSFAEGPVVTTSTPSPLDTPATRRQIGEALVDVLADLHAIDWQAAGLGDLGRPEGFNARHLRRMGRLVADADGAPPPHFAVIERWLAAHVPPESGASIVHNDYRIGNVVLAPDAPGRIAAVLDWELATIGDPLFDVGYFLASVPEADSPRTPTEDLGTALLEEGYPTRKELADRYADRTGRDLSNLDWYTALAFWKLAALYEYSRRRTVRGVGDPYYADQKLVQAFLAAAHRTAGLDEPPDAPADVSEPAPADVSEAAPEAVPDEETR